MNWRTYLMNVVECITNLPSSLWDDTCHEVSAGLLSGLVVISVSGMTWLAVCIVTYLYRLFKRKHAFVVFFREGVHGLSDFTDFKIITVGTHYLDVMVRAESPAIIRAADFRFVIDTKHLQSPRSDASTDDIEIISATDLDIPPPRFSSVTGQDQAGGVDIYYSPPYHRVQGQFLRVKIGIVAKNEWQGYLSFCESKVYSYHPFRVTP